MADAMAQLVLPLHHVAALDALGDDRLGEILIDLRARERAQRHRDDDGWQAHGR
jgi:hypothetical protein